MRCLLDDDLNINCECEKFKKGCRRAHGRKLHAGQVRVPEVETVLDDNDEVEFKPALNT